MLWTFSVHAWMLNQVQHDVYEVEPGTLEIAVTPNFPRSPGSGPSPACRGLVVKEKDHSILRRVLTSQTMGPRGAANFQPPQWSDTYVFPNQPGFTCEPAEFRQKYQYYRARPISHPKGSSARKPESQKSRKRIPFLAFYLSGFHAQDTPCGAHRLGLANHAPAVR